MVDHVSKINLNDYQTFFLEYYKDEHSWSHHIIRPCKSSYEEITDTNKKRTYTLEGAVISFTRDTTIQEALMECAIRGIAVDFIEILVPTEDSRIYSDHRCAQIIDMHKDNAEQFVSESEMPRHYVAFSKKKTDVLKYLVIDRYKQDSKIKFLNGEYDKKAVLAGFVDQMNAVEYCKKLNKNEQNLSTTPL